MRLYEFYENDRRRLSLETRYGTGWRSSKDKGYQFTLFWVAETNELCLMKAPDLDVRSDGMFSRFILKLPPHAQVQQPGDLDVHVEVLAHLEGTAAADVPGRMARTGR